MSNYYCLIAGLPDISIEDQKLTYTVKTFKEEVYEQLSLKDSKVFDLYFYKYDNANLLAYLKDKDAELDKRGNLDADQIEQLVKAIKEEDAAKLSQYPSYMPAFLEGYFSEQALTDNQLWEDQLAALYYEYALKSSNSLVAKWYEFNLNINNMLIASAARKFHFDAAAFIVGDNDVARALRTSSSRDWGLSGVVDYLEQMLRICDEADVYERERKIDLLKWNWLEEETFFSYFSIERLFAYLIKLEIIERWCTLNKEEGEKHLRQMVTRLKSEVKTPEDFQ